MKLISLSGDGSSTAAESSKEEKSHHELVPQLRFPPGYHFVPTEEELIDVYLRAKIDGRRPPLDVVNCVNVLEWEPSKLIEAYKGYGESKWYFFTVREKSSSKKEEPSRKLRVAGVEGTWKATGSLVSVRRRGTGRDGKPTVEVIGTKRILIYHSSDAVDHRKWSMHEYVMADKPEMDQYVLCTIQRKLHWDAKNNGGGGATTTGAGNKQKRDADTTTEPKTKRRKQTTISSQAQEVQQQQQEKTPGVSPEPPLTMHDEQAYYQASHEEEDPFASDATNLISAAAVPQGYPDGNHLQLGDFTANFHGSDMVIPVHTQDPVMFYGQGQQMLSYSYTDQFISPPISSSSSDSEHAQRQFQFHQQDHQSDNMFRELEQFAYPGPRALESAPHLSSNGSYEMASNGASTITPRWTGYGSGDHQFISAEQAAAAGDYSSSYQYNFDDFILGNGNGSNEASHHCQHGLQWRCSREERDTDMARCAACAPSCGL